MVVVDSSFGYSDAGGFFVNPLRVCEGKSWFVVFEGKADACQLPLTYVDQGNG